jgi:hypothetical protein
MTKIRLLLAITLSTVLALMGTVGLSVPPQASAAPTPSQAALKAGVKIDKKSKLTFSQADYASKKRVVVARFSTGRKGRPVSLQYADGKKWKVAATGKLDAKGRVRFTIKSLRYVNYRAVADVHKVGKKALAPVSTVTARPTPAAAPSPSEEAMKATVAVDKKSTLTFSPVDYGGNKRVVDVRFSTGHNRRFVSLQYKDGKKWVVAASSTTDAKGRATFTLKSIKNASYRAVADTHEAKKKIKPTSSTTVKPGSQWASTFKDVFSGTKLKTSWTTPSAIYAGSRLCSAPNPKMTKVTGGNLTSSVSMLDPGKPAQKKEIAAVTKAAKAEQQKRKNAAIKAAKKLKGTTKKKALAAANAMKVNGCPDGVFANAMVSTRSSFRQAEGMVAAKVKFPKDQGIHGSVWLQTSGGSRLKAHGAEIDMIESYGYGKGITSILQVDEKGSGRLEQVGGYVLKDKTNDPKWWDKYHIYSVEWTHSEFVFRVDGVETSRIAKKAVKGDEYFLVISLLSSDWETRLLTKPATSAKTPGVKKANLRKAKMQVDWIQAWDRV